MQYFLIPVLVILMALVVISLVRGIAAFLQTTKADLEADPASGPTANQLKQNKMMMSRILFQGLAILVVVVILMASRK